MNAEERNYLLQVLQESEELLLATIDEVSEEQFLQKESPSGWSLAEIIEHIIKIDQSVLHGIKHKAQDPPETIPKTFLKEKIIKAVSIRSTKVPSPEYGIPEGIFESKEDAINEFKIHRAGIESFVKNTDFPMKRIAFKHFALGLLNGEGWITFMAGHCHRHILQMEEIKTALKV